MNNLNKIICAVIASSMIISAFAGCGKKDEIQNNVTVSDSSSAASETEDTAKPDEIVSESSDVNLSRVKSDDTSSAESTDNSKAASSAAESKSGRNTASKSNTSSASESETLVVSAANTPMYSGEGGTGSVVRTLVKDEEVNVLEKTAGDFWKVKTKDGINEGYVRVNDLSRSGTVENSVTTVTGGGNGNGNGTVVSQGSTISGGSGTSSTADTTTTTVPDEPTQTTTQQTTTPTQTPNEGGDEDFKTAFAKAESNVGGNWDAALVDLSTGEDTVIYDSKMQAASLIKLYIMGAIYEKYDTYASVNSGIDNYLYSMITVSDNTAANTLVGILGSGNTDAGKERVNDYCRRHGYNNTSMGRLLLESTINGDNYTSVGDCARFLTAVYNTVYNNTDEVEHAEDMLNLLKQQTRTSKIPAGVPNGVVTANKTGELDLVQNDAAIVFAEKPYVLCVMSENVAPGGAVSAIVELSRETYGIVN